MRVLVTRPQPDGDATAALLRGMGHEPLVAPLLNIVMQGPDSPLDTDGVQAFLVTSANGARSLAAATDEKQIKVFAVGAASAEMAHSAGFQAVESADGDVETLAALVQARLRPENGRLLHVAGSVTAGDLAGALTKTGFAINKAALYRAETAEKLPDSIVTALQADTLDAGLFYSPRTARTFERLVAQAGLSEKLRKVGAFCLSPAVAEVLAGTSFANVQTSYAPDQVHLLELLGHSA